MSVFLSNPVLQKFSYEGESLGKRFCATSMQGSPNFRPFVLKLIGWRSHFEDAHIAKFNILPDISLFAVLDGHGGPEVAQFVAKHFESVLVKDSYFAKGDYGKALFNTFLEMDVLLRSPQGKKELGSIYKNPYGESMAGCTACVALIVKDKIYVASAGDSRCVIATKEGVSHLTKDHKPSEQPEKTRIEYAGGDILKGRINGNLNVSRAIGDLEYKDNDSISVHKQLIIADPDIRVWTMTNKDEFMIVGCDGIWDRYPSHEICKFISKELNSGKKLKQVNEALLDHLIAKDTRSGYGMDNMTCIIVTFI